MYWYGLRWSRTIPWSGNASIIRATIFLFHYYCFFFGMYLCLNMYCLLSLCLLRVYFHCTLSFLCAICSSLYAFFSLSTLFSFALYVFLSNQCRTKIDLIFYFLAMYFSHCLRVYSISWCFASRVKLLYHLLGSIVCTFLFPSPWIIFLLPFLSVYNYSLLLLRFTLCIFSLLSFRVYQFSRCILYDFLSIIFSCLNLSCLSIFFFMWYSKSCFPPARPPLFTNLC